MILVGPFQLGIFCGSVTSGYSGKFKWIFFFCSLTCHNFTEKLNFSSSLSAVCPCHSSNTSVTCWRCCSSHWEISPDMSTLAAEHVHYFPPRAITEVGSVNQEICTSGQMQYLWGHGPALAHRVVQIKIIKAVLCNSSGQAAVWDATQQWLHALENKPV